jgi:hypothetical protein
VSAIIKRGEFQATYQDGAWTANDPNFQKEVDQATQSRWLNVYAPDRDNVIAVMVAATLGATVAQLNETPSYDPEVEY